jgi:phage terminase large subunit
MNKSRGTATTERKPFTPHGAAWKLLHLQAPEVVLSGPAGTGKSVAGLLKLHLCAEHVPQLRALIVRRTRASLTESALISFEHHVVPPGHPILLGAGRANRQAYNYPNGSSIVVAGLDKPGRIMSTEWDLIFVQEAIELEEDAWEALTTRLRNHRLAYQQLLGDTNPDAPTHWLKRRCDSGQTILLESRHEDNPIITPEYLAKLDALTGPRLQRLRYGRWVQAEGIVYEGYDPRLHLIDRFEIPYDWPRLLSVDFGYTNPFTCQWWAIDPDGRLFRYREIYHTKRLVEDHARRILHLGHGEPRPVAILCDHDAEDRATLERYLDWETTAANKTKSPGLQAVAQRLKRAGDGKPRLFFLRDSLDERDPELADHHLPCCTEEEFDSYVWDVRLGRPTKDEPVKKNDHGMDALRYLVWSLDCEQAEADIATTVLRS